MQGAKGGPGDMGSVGKGGDMVRMHSELESCTENTCFIWHRVIGEPMEPKENEEHGEDLVFQDRT